MSKLQGKVAVITGGTSGMALATAKLFIEEGAHVFVTGRHKDKLDDAVAEIGRNATGVQGDAGNLDDLDRLAENVWVEKGRVDVLFARSAPSRRAFCPVAFGRHRRTGYAPAPHDPVPRFTRYCPPYARLTPGRAGTLDAVCPPRHMAGESTDLPATCGFRCPHLPPKV